MPGSSTIGLANRHGTRPGITRAKVSTQRPTGHPGRRAPPRASSPRQSRRCHACLKLLEHGGKFMLLNGSAG
eukprot:7211816-Pyramimonas_sp.AAC.1